MCFCLTLLSLKCTKYYVNGKCDQLNYQPTRKVQSAFIYTSPFVYSMKSPLYEYLAIEEYLYINISHLEVKEPQKRDYRYYKWCKNAKLSLPNNNNFNSRLASLLSFFNCFSISWLIRFCSLASSLRQHAMTTSQLSAGASLSQCRYQWHVQPNSLVWVSLVIKLYFHISHLIFNEPGYKTRSMSRLKTSNQRKFLFPGCGELANVVHVPVTNKICPSHYPIIRIKQTL